MRSTVGWFLNDKGYGFLLDEQGQPTIFIHYSGILGDGFKTLTKGEPVEFDVYETSKGRQAVSLRRLNGASQEGGE